MPRPTSTPDKLTDRPAPLPPGPPAAPTDTATQPYVVLIFDTEGHDTQIAATHRAHAMRSANDIIVNGFWLNDSLTPPHRIYSVTIVPASSLKTKPAP